MSYELVIGRLARYDLETAYRWSIARAPVAATRWFDRFQTALEKLQHRPERCPRAREHSKCDVDLRELLFGKKPYVFRVIFVIEPDKVRVLRVRRAQRRSLMKAELEHALEPDE